MAILQLGSIHVEAGLDLEFHDHAPIPSVAGGLIRVERAITTQEAAAIAAAIRGNDSNQLTTPHGVGIVSIKSMRWNPTTGFLHSLEGVTVKQWSFGGTLKNPPLK